MTAARGQDVAPRSGRPRSQAADDALLGATLDLLRHQGYGGLTMAAVIDRAGVSSATLYRRWATKQELVMAALETLRPEPTNTDTGTLEGDLLAFMRHTRGAIKRGWDELSEAIGVEAKRNSELKAAVQERFVVPRMNELTAILERAKQRGELRAAPPPEVALSLVLGPLHHHAILLGLPLTDGFLAKACHHALAGLQVACAAPPAPVPSS